MTIFHSEHIGGVDISADFLKIAFFSQKGAVTEWDHFNAAPLTPAAQSSKEALAADIKRLYESLNVSHALNNQVVVSIPENNLYIHSLTIPSAIPTQDIPYVIMNNATFSMPFDLEDVYDIDFAWQTLAVQGLSRRVALFLAKKSVISSYEQAIALAGLEAVALQTPIMGAEYMFDFPEGVTVLYFFEAASYTVASYLNGKVFFKRTIPLAHFDALADLIEKDFRRMQDFIMSELGEHQTFFLSLVFPFKGVSQVEAELKKKGLTVTPLNLKSLRIPQTIPDINPWFGLVGAGMRALLPRSADSFATLLPFSPKGQYLRKKVEAFFSRTTKIVFATLLFYILSFVGMGFFLATHAQKINQDFAVEQSQQLPSELVSLENEAAQFNTAVSQIAAVKDKVHSAVPALDAVRNINFQGIDVTHFEIHFGTDKIAVTIAGHAGMREQFLDFQKYLEQQKGFADVVAPPQSLEARQNINFSITFSYVS